jgi:polyphosphate glucokinase
MSNNETAESRWPGVWRNLVSGRAGKTEHMQILGIDVGGSGIKGAPVDTETGRLLADRLRIKTPSGAEPKDVAAVATEIVEHFDWHGPVGFGFPAAVKHGIAKTAANISHKWIGVNADDLFTQATRCPCTVHNDADVAGLAEVRFGAGRGQPGLVIMVTLGTGIGTAIIFDGRLVPNSELGHIEIEGKEGEDIAADSARQEEKMSWKKYAKHLNRYLSRLEALFWPDLFILGGGISKEHDKFVPRLEVEAPVVPAQLLNEAGIVGAALMAAETRLRGGR